MGGYDYEKRSLLIIALALCLLFSGFTRVESDVPSAGFTSTSTEVGTFTVEVPDYYGHLNNGVYMCYENGEAKAGLVMVAAENTTATKANFNSAKLTLLDALANKIASCQRNSYKDATIAGCPAVIGYYKDGSGQKGIGVLVFNEKAHELLFIFCALSPNTVYADYEADFNRMLDGIVLTKH